MDLEIEYQEFDQIQLDEDDWVSAVLGSEEDLVNDYAAQTYS